MADPAVKNPRWIMDFSNITNELYPYLYAFVFVVTAIAFGVKHVKYPQYTPQTLFYILLLLSSALQFFCQMLIEYSVAFDHTSSLWINWFDSAPVLIDLVSGSAIQFFSAAVGLLLLQASAWWLLYVLTFMFCMLRAEINQYVVGKPETYEITRKRIRLAFWAALIFTQLVLFFGLLALQVTDHYKLGTHIFLAYALFPLLEFISCVSFLGYSISLHMNIKQRFTVMPVFLRSQLKRIQMISIIWGVFFLLRITARVSLTIFILKTGNGPVFDILAFFVEIFRTVLPTCWILYLLRRPSSTKVKKVEGINNLSDDSGGNGDGMGDEVSRPLLPPRKL